MTPSSSDDDEILLAQVRDATATAGAAGDAIRRAARAAFATRMHAPGRLLARLSYDSVLEVGSVRAGAGDRRVVTFDAPALSVEIEISADRLLGQIVPPLPAEVELMTPAGVVGTTSADACGCFVLAPPAPGPVRFGCRTGAGLVVTDWVRL